MKRAIAFVKRTLVDQVEDVHLALYENEKYRALCFAAYDEQAVEGAMVADDTEVARMIRDKASKIGLEELAHQKLWAIVKSWRTVMRRYESGRKQRREMNGHAEAITEGGSDGQ